LKIDRAKLVHEVLSKASSTGLIKSEDHDDIIEIAEKLGLDPNELSVDEIESVITEYGKKVFSIYVSSNGEKIGVAIYKVLDPVTNERRYVAILGDSTESGESVEIYATNNIKQAVEVAESFLSEVKESFSEEAILAIVDQAERKLKSLANAREEELENVV